MSNHTDKKFAVFDIDGTLVRWQLYHAVVDRLAKNDLLGKEARVEIGNARMKWKRREHKDSYKAYEMLLVRQYESALHNLAVADFDKAVDEVIDQYKDQVYTFTRDLIADLKKQNYFLVAISGSHQELVRHIAKTYGFDDFIGSRYERKNGKFTGKSMIGSNDKAKTLKKLIEKHTLSLTGSVGIGDSKSDAPMLELVERPIAFNPDRELLKIAQTASWPIIVERKNVVYKLTPDKDTYQLAETTA